MTQSYVCTIKSIIKKQGNETVTNCHGLKMQAADEKMRMTDAVMPIILRWGIHFVSSLKCRLLMGKYLNCSRFYPPLEFEGG